MIMNKWLVSKFFLTIILKNQATFEELDPYLVAASSIWIATKGCEELQLRLRDVVNVVYRALNPDSKPGLSINSLK